jgi:cell division cycle 2-like protein
MTSKRDRWASSSDEDEAPRKKKDGGGKKNKKTKQALQEDVPAAAAAVAAQLPSQPPLHNPLLHGCRSVYDTYEQIQRLNEGAYGIVWKARDLATGEICALKQIKFHASLEYSMNSSRQLWKEGFPVTALREISVLLALSSHANVVSVKEMVVGDNMDQVYMAMEYFDCDLKVALRRAAAASSSSSTGGGPLSQSNLKGILQQILTGMAHVHDKRYLHRDMKTSNLLVQRQSGRIALADFGLARRYYHSSHDDDYPATATTNRSMTLPVVTLWYRAPELLFGEARYGPAIDVWSVGCIFGELIQSGGNYGKSVDDNDEENEDEGNAILKGRGEIDQIDQIFSLLGGPTEANWPSFTSLPNASLLRWKSVEEPRFHQVFRSNAIGLSSTSTFLDANGLDLLQSMLRLDPHRRITAQAALDHAYFKQGVQPSIPHYFTAALTP